MAAGGQETEAKFYVRDLNRSRRQLEALGARLVQKRVLEQNIRFDLPGARLRAEGRVLRLRQDTLARITYKGASTKEKGVLRREEIEFVVEDFEKARQLLEALGYEKLVYYEKYRTTYSLGPSGDPGQRSGEPVYVMLDELPYGDFVEIEGESVEAIQAVAGRLQLNWEAAIGTSYTALFERVQRARSGSLSLPDLSFAVFEGVQVDPATLGVQVADRQG
jgi:adenylate cyclase class 2